MSGIVFNESSNIYQDQAKVLFDYYKQAAELIVSQEMELEDAIKKAQYELDTMQKDYEQEITRQEQYIKQKNNLDVCLIYYNYWWSDNVFNYNEKLETDIRTL